MIRNFITNISRVEKQMTRQVGGIACVGYDNCIILQNFKSRNRKGRYHFQNPDYMGR
jgi:hypothetical protein